MFSPSFRVRLREARCFVAFTGAGMSAESGVSTFRGEDGIWKKFKPEELANLGAFIRNPELVWEWYAHRKKILSTVQPNPGHYALAEMENLFQEMHVITQNIDNLHDRAGSQRVYELHGNVERNYCIDCRTPFTNEQLNLEEGVPRCGGCGGLIRPDVVWFGELIPVDAWERSVEACERADLFFCIGTSGIVYPAASLPGIARRSGAYVVEINPEYTMLSHSVDETLIGKAGEILPKIVSLLKKNDN
ncbi:MAG: NAD-dependent deacetylase [Bacteroidota bacterium]